MSHFKLHLFLIATGLLSFPQEAFAGWYYTWTCTGITACPAAEGREGPYSSFLECEEARTNDPRYLSSMGDDAFYSLLGACEEDNPQAGVVYVPPAQPNTTTPPRISKVEVGFSGGPGWSAIEPGGARTQSAPSLGFFIDSHTGKDSYGGSILTGLSFSRLSSPTLGAGEHNYLTLPLLLGIAFTPRVAMTEGRELRLDLGASFGVFAGLACSDCAEGALDDIIGIGYALKAGVDVFFNTQTGVSIDFLSSKWSMTDRTSGLTVQSPPWMIRVSLIARPEPQ